MAQLSVDYTYTDTTATDISSIGGLQEVNTLNTGQHGSIDENSCPGNVTWAIKFLTGHVGRAFRGRNFVPALPEGHVASNAVDPTWAAATVADYQAMLAAVAAAGFTPVVVSRRLDGAERAAGVTTPISLVTFTDLNTDSQRRRLNGRGA